MELTEQDLADYLAAHPEFFERHAELLASVQLSSPHGDRAVSLHERQMDMLRGKMRQLEHRLAELMQLAADNEHISERLLDWTATLLREQDPAQLPEILTRELREQFELPQAALKLWGAAPEHAAADFTIDADADLQAFCNSLQQPYCGANAGFAAAAWLAGEPAQSLALIPLRDGAEAPAFGLLVLGSPQADRFSADMGVEFLQRIGQLAGAAVAPLLQPAEG